MLRVRPGWYWQITWRFVSPLIVLVIFVCSLFNMGMKPVTYSAWRHNEVGHLISLLFRCAVLPGATLMNSESSQNYWTGSFVGEWKLPVFFFFFTLRCVILKGSTSCHGGFRPTFLGQNCAIITYILCIFNYSNTLSSSKTKGNKYQINFRRENKQQ